MWPKSPEMLRRSGRSPASAELTCFVPSLLVNSFSGLLRPIQVAKHRGRAAKTNLSRPASAKRFRSVNVDDLKAKLMECRPFLKSESRIGTSIPLDKRVLRLFHR